MVSPHESGNSGYNSTFAIIAVIAIAPHISQMWLTVFFGMIVVCGLVEDWASRK